MRRFAEITFGICFVALLLVACSIADGQGILFWQADGFRVAPNGTITDVIIDVQSESVAMDDTRCHAPDERSYVCLIPSLSEPTSFVINQGVDVSVCASYLRQSRPRIACLGN